MPLRLRGMARNRGPLVALAGVEPAGQEKG